jgi:hypothetical protein
MGMATLQEHLLLQAGVDQSQWAKYAQWVQVSVDGIKWLRPEGWAAPRSRKLSGLFPWRATTKSLDQIKPVSIRKALDGLNGTEYRAKSKILARDVVRATWNEVAPLVQDLVTELDKLPKLEAMVMAQHLRPEMVALPQQDDFTRAEDLRIEYSQQWLKLFEVHGSAVPQEVVNDTIEHWQKVMGKESLAVRTAMMLGEASFALKSCCIKKDEGWWSKFCAPRRDALRGAAATIEGRIWVDSPEQLPTAGIPMTVRFQHLDGACMVLAAQDKRMFCLGTGRIEGRVSRKITNARWAMRDDGRIVISDSKAIKFIATA